jgi:integrase
VSGAWIRARERATGKSYAVCYRRGGRDTKVEYAGTFKTMKDARIRRDAVAGELAAGRDPRLFLLALSAPRPVARTVEAAFDAWLASLLDLQPKSIDTYRSHRGRIVSAFGPRDPRTITSAETQAWANELATGPDAMKPRSIHAYMLTLRQVLDAEGVDPNPARGVRLPRVVREQIRPMTRAQFHALLEAAPARWHLILRLLEATGLRVGELLAITWGDVDFAENRLLLPASAVKGKRRAHFAQVPEPLMLEIADSVPPDDRVGRLFTMSTDAVRDAMRRACQNAGLPHFHPHDFRHRRISLWHAQGVPGREVQYRVGHENLEEHLQTYVHVVVDPSDDDWIGDS